MYQNCIHFGVQKTGFFSLFLSLCSGASRGARGPHPANPKAPQRRFMGAIVGALGRQSDAPNARKMTQRRPLDLISGKNELQWSFKTHSESFFLFCKLFRGKRWPLESILAPYGPNMCWACPGHLFSQYFPTPFPDVILNLFFMLRSTVLLQMKVDIFPTPCVTSSLSCDDSFMLFPFGRPYGTGGISAWR